CMSISFIRMESKLMAGGAKLAGVLTLVLGLLAFSGPLFSQTTTGRILGGVHDAQDAAIVGAKLTITDVLRGTTRTLVTDESGDYVAADLPPSTYKVHIEAKGFNSFERQDIG